MPTYNFKMVNGVKTATTTPDKTKCAQRDAAGWSGVPPDGPALARDSASKVGRLAQSFGLTIEELKAELAK